MELVRRKGEEIGGGRVEGEGGSEVGEALGVRGRRREELDGVEGSPGHGGEVERGEVGEFLKCDGFGEGVSGADLTVDLGECAGDDGGLGGGIGAEGLDEVIEGALEEGIGEGGGGGEDGGGGGGGGGRRCHGGMEGTWDFWRFRISRVNLGSVLELRDWRMGSTRQLGGTRFVCFAFCILRIYGQF